MAIQQVARAKIFTKLALIPRISLTWRRKWERDARQVDPRKPQAERVQYFIIGSKRNVRRFDTVLLLIKDGLEGAERGNIYMESSSTCYAVQVGLVSVYEKEFSVWQSIR